MTKTTWNLKELRDYAKNKLPKADLTISQIDSIDRTVNIFRYHMFSAKKLIDEIESKNEYEKINLIIPYQNTRNKLEETKIGIQSETQATIHNARSIHEIFSQIVNSLLLNSYIKIENCTLFSLSKNLKESELKEYIEETLHSDSYLYVNSFVNIIKHRNLVKLHTHFDLQEGRGGIKFESFEYNKKTFPSLWAIDVIKNALDVKNRVIFAGILLNEEIRRDLSY